MRRFFMFNVNDYHLRLFYEGCIADKGYVSKDEKQTARNMRDYLEVIEELKRECQ